MDLKTLFVIERTLSKDDVIAAPSFALTLVTYTVFIVVLLLRAKRNPPDSVTSALSKVVPVIVVELSVEAYINPPFLPPALLKVEL